MKLGDGSRKKGKHSRRATKADKVQRYPWETTEPPGGSAKFGALEVPDFKVDARPSVQAVHLFVDVQEIVMLRGRVAQAGVPTDLMGVPEEEIIRAITEAVGAKPNPCDSTDLKASEAFFLSAFAQIDFWMRRDVESGKAEGASLYGLMLGRCIEWWRWRRQGHDLGAVQQASFSSGRDKELGAEAATQSKDRRWREIAEIVGKLGDAPRFEVGKRAGQVHFHAWAREVLKEARIDSALAHRDGNHAKAGILNEIAGQTEKTVISAIKFAIQSGETGKTK